MNYKLMTRYLFLSIMTLSTTQMWASQEPHNSYHWPSGWAGHAPVLAQLEQDDHKKRLTKPENSIQTPVTIQHRTTTTAAITNKLKK